MGLELWGHALARRQQAARRRVPGEPWVGSSEKHQPVSGSASLPSEVVAAASIFVGYWLTYQDGGTDAPRDPAAQSDLPSGERDQAL